MKPRFSLSFYPLKDGGLWIVLTKNRPSGFTNYYTTLDAADHASFRNL
jgi:hypothetical protein